MNEKAIRKLETLSWLISNYMKTLDSVATENKMDSRERIQGMGAGLIQAKEHYLISLKSEVDRSIAELKEDDTYMIDDLDYEGEMESA